MVVDGDEREKGQYIPRYLICVCNGTETLTLAVERR